VSFSCGFATKGALHRHNGKYHAAVVNSVNLSEGISLALRQIRKSPAVRNLRLQNTSEQEARINVAFKIHHDEEYSMSNEWFNEGLSFNELLSPNERLTDYSYLSQRPTGTPHSGPNHIHL
jgi:hypothetical protein